jgi:hypothetical protein
MSERKQILLCTFSTIHLNPLEEGNGFWFFSSVGTQPSERIHAPLNEVTGLLSVRSNRADAETQPTALDPGERNQAHRQLRLQKRSVLQEAPE